MSYQDLEDELSSWLALETLAKELQASVKATKEFRVEKMRRGPMHRPDAPVKRLKVVTMLVETIRRIPLSEWTGTTADWLSQLSTRRYSIDTISALTAELEAIKQAKADGYLWHETLSIVTQP